MNTHKNTLPGPRNEISRHAYLNHSFKPFFFIRHFHLSILLWQFKLDPHWPKSAKSNVHLDIVTCKLQINTGQNTRPLSWTSAENRCEQLSDIRYVNNPGSSGEEMASSPLGDKRLCRLINRKIHTNMIVKRTRNSFSKRLKSDKRNAWRISVCTLQVSTKNTSESSPFPTLFALQEKTLRECIESRRRWSANRGVKGRFTGGGTHAAPSRFLNSSVALHGNELRSWAKIGRSRIANDIYQLFMQNL